MIFYFDSIISWLLVATACLPGVLDPKSSVSNSVVSMPVDDAPPTVQPTAEDVLLWQQAMNDFASTGVTFQENPRVEQFTEAIGGRDLTVAVILWWLDKQQLSKFGTFRWGPICTEGLDPVLEKLVNLRGNGSDAVSPIHM